MRKSIHQYQRRCLPAEVKSTKSVAADAMDDIIAESRKIEPVVNFICFFCELNSYIKSGKVVMSTSFCLSREELQGVGADYRWLC